MNVVMIIPTGIGCEIGGHAGDATPAARLLGSVCDKLILHPNVVNASDINEMPENALYVEGSILDRFLQGKIELREVRQNKILVVLNKPVLADTVNAVSAARTTLGIDASIVELRTLLRMIGKVNEGGASGEVYGWFELVRQVKEYDFDALAITSMIEVAEGVSMHYYQHGGINPWGGVEAMASKLIASKLNKPVAHAPIQSEEDTEADKSGKWNFITDPRIAPEIISKCFLHCVLKGLHKAPRIGKGLSVKDVDVMVSPHGCWGKPHIACQNAGIPIIEVLENQTIYSTKGLMRESNYPMVVENYLEAVGVIAAMNAGVMLESVHRPLKYTEVVKDG